MKREELEHIVRAACDVTGERELLVIGSQAILGSFSEKQLPAAATVSAEADIAAFNDPDDALAFQISGALGEHTQFHSQFGVYAEGVSVHTATPPDGWRKRLVRLRSAKGDGLCLEPHDLVLAKLARGASQDYRFANALVDAGLLNLDILEQRLQALPVRAVRRDGIGLWLWGKRRLGTL